MVAWNTAHALWGLHWGSAVSVVPPALCQNRCLASSRVQAPLRLRLHQAPTQSLPTRPGFPPRLDRASSGRPASAPRNRLVLETSEQHLQCQEALHCACEAQQPCTQIMLLQRILHACTEEIACALSRDVLVGACHCFTRVPVQSRYMMPYKGAGQSVQGCTPCWAPEGEAASPAAEGAPPAALVLGRREAARLALRCSLDRSSSSLAFLACIHRWLNYCVVS